MSVSDPHPILELVDPNTTVTSLWNVAGLAGLALIDSAGFPSMGGPDILIIFLAHTTTYSILFLGLVAAIGSTLGALILYHIASKSGQYALQFFRVSPGHSSFLQHQMRDWETFTILLAALAPPPVPKKPIVVVAGIMKVDQRKFVLGMMLGRSIRYTFLALIGRNYGDSAIELFALNTQFVVVVVTVLAVVALCIFIVRCRTRAGKDDDPLSKVVVTVGHDMRLRANSIIQQI